MPAVLDPPALDRPLDRPMLLDWPLTRFLSEEPPRPLADATNALEQAEVTRATSDVAAFVRPTLQWLDRASDVVFPAAADQPPEHAVVLQRARLVVSQAPLYVAFSGWRLRFGTRGVWLALVDRVREVALEYGVVARPLDPSEAQLADYPLKVPGQGMWTGPESVKLELSAHDLFYSICKELQQRVADQSALDEIRTVLGLTETDLAALLGVRRQAVAQWRTRGLPAEREAQVDELRQLCRDLTEVLRPDRIPAVVRRSVPNLGGRTWLDWMQEHGPADTRDRLRAVFSFQTL